MTATTARPAAIGAELRADTPAGPRWSPRRASPPTSPTPRSPTTGRHVRRRAPRPPARRRLPRRPDPGRARRRRRRLGARRARRHVAPRPRRRGDVDRRQHALRRAAQHRAPVAHRRRPAATPRQADALRGASAADRGRRRRVRDGGQRAVAAGPHPAGDDAPCGSRAAGASTAARSSPRWPRAATVINVAVTFVDDDGEERYGFALVPSTAPGVEFPHDWDALGMRASESGSVVVPRRRASAPTASAAASRPGATAPPCSTASWRRAAFHAAASLGIAESAHARIVDVAARQGRRRRSTTRTP